MSFSSDQNAQSNTILKITEPISTEMKFPLKHHAKDMGPDT